MARGHSFYSGAIALALALNPAWFKLASLILAQVKFSRYLIKVYTTKVQLDTHNNYLHHVMLMGTLRNFLQMLDSFTRSFPPECKTLTY